MANIKLKDEFGTYQTYNDISTIRMKDTSDNDVIFSEGAAPSGTINITPSTSSQQINVAPYAQADVAAIPVATLDNTIINGSAFEEASGDYAWRSTVNVPAGYHNAQVLTKDFSSIFPAPQTEGTADKMLLGYELFNHEGKKLTGTMANNGAVSKVISTQNGTYTIPAGYHNGSGVITASINTGSATTPATTKAQSTPSISVNSSGLITASVAATSVNVTPTVSAGYVSAGTAGTITMSASSATKQLSTQAATTITPGTSSKTAVAAGKYTTGAVTVAGSSNLVAGNIKSGVNIFGVTGSYVGGSSCLKVTSFSSSHSGSYYYITLGVSGLPASANIKAITPVPVHITDVTPQGGGGTNTSYHATIWYNSDVGVFNYSGYSYDSVESTYSPSVGWNSLMTINQISANSIQIRYYDQYSHITDWGVYDWLETYVFYS